MVPGVEPTTPSSKLHAPSAFRGFLYRPGQQAGARHDEIEVDKERFKLDRYCNEAGVRCTSDLIGSARPRRWSAHRGRRVSEAFAVDHSAPRAPFAGTHEGDAAA
jgi:hypothetical protein